MNSIFWIAIASAALLPSSQAVKCSHCAYINDGTCERVPCEGKFCALQINIDTRTNTVLVHKSCEQENAFAISGLGCANVSQHDVESLTCVCNTDLCTDSEASDLEYVRQLLLAQQSVPLSLAGVADDNSNSTAEVVAAPPADGPPTTAPPPSPAQDTSTAPEGTTPTAASIGDSQGGEAIVNETSAGDSNQTVPVFWGAWGQMPEVWGAPPVATSEPEMSPGTSEPGTSPGEAEATSAGTEEPPTETAVNSTASIESGGMSTEPPEASEGSGEGPDGAPEGVTDSSDESSTESPEPMPTEIPEELPEDNGNTTSNAPTEGSTSAAEITGATVEEGSSTPGGTEEPTTTPNTTAGTPEGTEGATTTPGGTTAEAPESSTGVGTPSNGTDQNGTEATSPLPVSGEPNAVIAEAPTSQVNTNVSAGLEELQAIVNERVQLFSAVSLQRLPPYLAENTILTPDRQHYDVLTSRLDGDMTFNQNQLDLLVQSQRIYLPPKSIHEESNGPEPFNGVLIGNDLEQMSAWQQLQAISYVFQPTVDNETRAIIRRAMDQWQGNTCVRFAESSATTGPSVLVIDSLPPPADVVACGASTVGMWPDVKLMIWKAGPTEHGCATVGTIAHELGHILGLWHAQSRFDAYQYVYVPADKNGNVDVHPQSSGQANYDVGYDYGSIMHFAEDALRPKDPRYAQTTGQKREPSFIDYKTINLQQKCLDLCPPSNCFVGGYATPPDCAKCHCPIGFGGDRCEKFSASVGECGEHTGAVFATDDWKDLEVDFTGANGPDKENECFWHIWGKNGSQVELEVVNVSMHFSQMGCVDDKTGERNFIEIKIGDNDADKSFDFQRTGFRLCNLDPLAGQADRPIISTNRLIVLAAYTGSPGKFVVRYRNAGGGNQGLAAALHAAGLASPVRPGIRVSASENATAGLMFEAGEEAPLGGRGRQTAATGAASAESRCEVRRSLVPGDRLASPCRVLRSMYGRYTYVFTRRGRHRIYYNDRYFEPRILIYDARQTPSLKNGVMINEKVTGVIRIQDEGGATYDPFPSYLAAEKQQVLGPLKLLVTEDGRLVARSHNGTEVTLVCLAHFSCVRLHRRLQGLHESSNDSRVMLQGGILYSENRLFFSTLSARGEFAVYQREKASDPLSASSSKIVWVFGPTPKGRTGQPYRLMIERDGSPSIRDGDDEIVWRVNATSPLTKDQLPTTLSLTDQGKLTLQDAQGKEVWTN